MSTVADEMYLRARTERESGRPQAAEVMTRAGDTIDELVGALEALRSVAVWDDDFDNEDRAQFSIIAERADAALAKADGR